MTPLQEHLWHHISIRLRALKLYNDAFWPSIYAFVVALAALHQADAATDAFTVPGRDGSEKKHPAATIANQMLAHVRTYAAELGLTSSALATFGPPLGRPSELDRLIRGDDL